jgi:hypothetical protein
MDSFFYIFARVMVGTSDAIGVDVFGVGFDIFYVVQNNKLVTYF